MVGLAKVLVEAEGSAVAGEVAGPPWPSAGVWLSLDADSFTMTPSPMSVSSFVTLGSFVTKIPPPGREGSVSHLI